MGTVRRSADPMRFGLPVHLAPYTNTLTVASRGGRRLHRINVGRQNVMARVEDCRVDGLRYVGEDFRHQPFRLIGFQVGAASHRGMLDT